MIALIIALAAGPVEPACIRSVHDGDTFTLCDGRKIRLHNYDAPERIGSPACRPDKAARHWCDTDLGERAAVIARAKLTSSRVMISMAERLNA